MSLSSFNLSKRSYNLANAAYYSNMQFTIRKEIRLCQPLRIIQSESSIQIDWHVFYARKYALPILWRWNDGASKAAQIAPMKGILSISARTIPANTGVTTAIFSINWLNGAKRIITSG